MMTYITIKHGCHPVQMGTSGFHIPTVVSVQKRGAYNSRNVFCFGEESNRRGSSSPGRIWGLQPLFSNAEEGQQEFYLNKKTFRKLTKYKMLQKGFHRCFLHRSVWPPPVQIVRGSSDYFGVWL